MSIGGSKAHKDIVIMSCRLKIEYIYCKGIWQGSTLEAITQG